VAPQEDQLRSQVQAWHFNLFEVYRSLNNVCHALGFSERLQVLTACILQSDETAQVIVSNRAAAELESPHTQHIRNVVRPSILFVTNGQLYVLVAGLD